MLHTKYRYLMKFATNDIFKVFYQNPTGSITTVYRWIERFKLVETQLKISNNVKNIQLQQINSSLTETVLSIEDL